MEIGSSVNVQANIPCSSRPTNSAHILALFVKQPSNVGYCLVDYRLLGTTQCGSQASESLSAVSRVCRCPYSKLL